MADQENGGSGMGRVSNRVGLGKRGSGRRWEGLEKAEERGEKVGQELSGSGKGNNRRSGKGGKQ